MAFINEDEEVLHDLRTWTIEKSYGEHHYIVNLATIIVCILGYLTHTLNVIVLSKTPLSNSMHIFLIGLSLTEILKCTLLIADFAHYFNGFKLYGSYEWVVMVLGKTFLDCLFQIVLNSLAAVLGIWCCVAITWPLKSPQLCSPCRAKVTIIVILVISIISSVPNFVLFAYRFHKIGSILTYYLGLADPYESMRSLKIYELFKQFISLVQMILILVAIIWTCISLRKTGIEREGMLDQETSHPINRKISAMLIILLFCYLLSNILDIVHQFISVLYLHDFIDEEGLYHALESIRCVCILFLMIKNSVPFPTYYELVVDFRRNFHRLFCRCINAREAHFNGGHSESMMLEAAGLTEGFEIQRSTSLTQCLQENEANERVELETN